MLQAQKQPPTSSSLPVRSSNARLKAGDSFNAATNDLLPSHIIVTFDFARYEPLDLDLQRVVVGSPEVTPPDSPTPLKPPPSLSHLPLNRDKDQQTSFHHSPFTPLIPSIILYDEDKIGSGAIAECYETTYTGTPIVLKCVRNIDNEGHDCEQHRLRLHHEAAIYSRLKHLQGRILPRFYGLYEIKGLEWTVMILEHAGSSLTRLPKPCKLDALSDDQKTTLLSYARELHDLGIKHSDLRPDNITVDNSGNVKIVDFELATEDHQCDDKCWELVKLCRNLRLPGP
ncbi:hypothetical protein BT96DRAFT_704055 [Gymnopus androsaceus JB14]|uniref:Protein kinase domain-containing protein n=1 Tax=Gymnopus androsaceus JB14 TaxID=1447944 RepID=A0A6A4HR59_9AGAR|nr:hypothetical protein BT96DRAFT_704055 [Gymnopus androsaceus JB14]